VRKLTGPGNGNVGFLFVGGPCVGLFDPLFYPVEDKCPFFFLFFALYCPFIIVGILILAIVFAFQFFGQIDRYDDMEIRVSIVEHFPAGITLHARPAVAVFAEQYERTIERSGEFAAAFHSGEKIRVGERVFGDGRFKHLFDAPLSCAVRPVDRGHRIKSSVFLQIIGGMRQIFSIEIVAGVAAFDDDAAQAGKLDPVRGFVADDQRFLDVDA
jgi:hypothetical protein